MTDTETVWFERKPRPIEARQFTPTTREEAEKLAEWCGGEFCWYVMEPSNKDNWWISLRPSYTQARYGDWVARDEGGQFIAVSAAKIAADYNRRSS
ncbi:hypothetical protein ABZ215_24955 [Amycolatopsis sp. NPDC006131]|uniref:hypothetical protein n=1 Tax=Amycolatopsis sp. NPDC006131 TaxID=3156731 RepID=UPI0033A99E88